MRNLNYIRTTTLEGHVAADGQRFTDLIQRWAQAYFGRCGIGNTEFSINGVSFRADGGSDGIVDAPNCVDPLGFLRPKSVFQFKAGLTTKAKIEEELEKEPTDDSRRIIDLIRDDFTVIWFTGKGLTDIQLVQLEKDLLDIVRGINPNAPKPVVIDANRFCRCLSKTPAIAASIVGADGLFVTAEKRLASPPHSKFTGFVPGANFQAFKDDIGEFFTNVGDGDQIKYIAGEPGIGKSRCALEAVDRTPQLKGGVCYFEDQSRVGEFFRYAIQEDWTGACIVDEYIGQTANTVAVTSENVPRGVRVLLIGNSYTVNRSSAAVTNEMQPLTEDEQLAALQETFKGLQEFRIREAIRLSKKNLRLARSICDYLQRNPGQELGLDGLEAIVDYELDKMAYGREALACLSLIPLLVSDQLDAFCQLVSIDQAIFKKACRDVSQSSGLIQATEHTYYVGAPAIGQVALVRLWREEPDKVSRILGSPGSFFDGLLTSIKRLPQCNEKDEMLAFFKLPVASLGLPDLMEFKSGRHLMQLVTADPDTYLPVIHRTIKESVGHLTEYPYEGAPVGRRELIWKLRELAQFPEYFVLCEEILYLLAREEVPSGYANVATSYWPGWFGAYFDNTVFPYSERLAILKGRASAGDALDRKLVLKAVSNPFPDFGSDIPSDRVGGRLAPPELRFIHHEQIEQAASTIPEIVSILLALGDGAFRAEVAKRINACCFSWLERGALRSYLKMVRDPNYPAEAFQELIVEVRHYVNLELVMNDEPEPRIRYMREQHKKLLAEIDGTDPFLEVLEIAAHGHWREEDKDEAKKQVDRILSRFKSDPAFRQRVLEVLSDPAKYGGMSLGQTIGPELTENEIDELVFRSQQRGYSQFSYAALRHYATEVQGADAIMLTKARALEKSDSKAALAIYQALGDKVYFVEASRLLAETDVSTEFFGGMWLRSSEELQDYHWPYIRAIEQRAANGDAFAASLCVTIAGSLAYIQCDLDEAIHFGFLALRLGEVARGHGGLKQWDDIAMWLLPRDPIQVIGIAARKEQSEFSKATKVLSAAAKQYSRETLEALAPKLRDPYKPPYLMVGGLTAVFANVNSSTFSAWLKEQDDKVVINVAAQIPKPTLVEGEPNIPEITRAFWEYCVPTHRCFEKAMGNFQANTFNTGVYFGHGVDLFSQRVVLARKVLLDQNPSLRIWAEGHLKSSEGHLEDARREENVANARRDIDDN